jgi:hypothetical protein
MPWLDGAAPVWASVGPPCKAWLVHDIETAIATIRARDAGAARLAHGLWGAMRMSAAHPEKVTRYDVQHLCWGALPRLPAGGGPGAAAVLAELLELLGYPRYAKICRGETTARILAADAADRPDLVRAAWRSSGVDPPDTPVLTWGEARGPVEQAVHAATGRILEEAIDAGTLVLTGPEVETTRESLTMLILRSPAEGMPGTWYSQIFEERLTAWLTAGGSQTRRELLVRVRPEVAKPPKPDRCQELAPLQTLLEACVGDGVRLTRSGYLPTALVHDLVELMRACVDHPGKGNRESSWPPVGALRLIATELELISQVGNWLYLDPSAWDYFEDPGLLVMGVGERLVDRDASVLGVVQEVLFAALLLEDTVELDRLLGKVVTVVEEEGWAQPAGELDTATVVREFAWIFLHRLHMLDVVDVEDGREFGLTLAGEAVARWALRTRVMLREVTG